MYFFIERKMLFLKEIELLHILVIDFFYMQST